MNRRLLIKEESGFTLPEMLVTMLLMTVVLFALQNVFDASLRVFKFGNDKIEAVENVRLGLERMEREIRAAHPYNLSNNYTVPTDTTDDYLFFNASAVGVVPTVAFPSQDQITFGNDRGTVGTANRKLECGSPCEYVTYKLRSTANEADLCTTATAPCTLRRVNTAAGSSNVLGANAGEAVVDYVPAGGLTFSYFDSNNNPVTNGIESEIRKVRISLRVDVSGKTQTLTTDVDLRNRGD